MCDERVDKWRALQGHFKREHEDQMDKLISQNDARKIVRTWAYRLNAFGNQLTNEEYQHVQPTRDLDRTKVVCKTRCEFGNILGTFWEHPS